MSQQRNTPQRKIIESFLEESDSPMLPKELHEKAQEKIPSLGIATVFRALKNMLEEGKVRVVHIPGDSPRYESTQQKHHHHFKCVDCGQVYDLYKCPGDMERLLPSGFQLIDHDITLFGKCSDCVK